MPRWLEGVLPTIHHLAVARRVRFTYKAIRELAALDLGLDEADCCTVLENLTAADSTGRIKSKLTGEWMYVFKPKVGGTRLYVKVILRADCIVISFHEEGEHRAKENAP